MDTTQDADTMARADAETAVEVDDETEPEPETAQGRYARERREQSVRIAGIKETAMFRTKGDLYTKLSPQDKQREDESDDELQARMDSLMESLTIPAYHSFVSACMQILTNRKNSNEADWRECLGDLYSVRYAVKEIVRQAFGFSY